jgi:cyclohexyl-isocyanide hydratase
MEIAFILFNGMTSLDFIGVYDPLTRLKSMGFMPELEWVHCALEAEVSDDRGLLFSPDQVECELAEFDMVIVPGGLVALELRFDHDFVSWLQTAEDVPIKASVCTGSLLLGAAGFLEGYRATSHLSTLELLEEYGATPSQERVVDEGGLVTARGVTSSIDLGLHLVERIAGFEVRRKIAVQMDYERG